MIERHKVIIESQVTLPGGPDRHTCYCLTCHAKSEGFIIWENAEGWRLGHVETTNA